MEQTPPPTAPFQPTPPPVPADGAIAVAPASPWGDQPVGAPTLPTASRTVRRRGAAFGGLGSIVVVAGVVVRLVLSSSGHGSPSDVAVRYRAAVHAFTVSDQLDRAIGDPVAALNTRETSLRTFDITVRGLPIPASALADRQAVLDADSAFESSLDGVVHGVVDSIGTLDALERTHVDAINKLGHDLGLGDVLHLVQPSPG